MGDFTHSFAALCLTVFFFFFFFFPHVCFRTMEMLQSSGNDWKDFLSLRKRNAKLKFYALWFLCVGESVCHSKQGEKVGHKGAPRWKRRDSLHFFSLHYLSGIFSLHNPSGKEIHIFVYFLILLLIIRLNCWPFQLRASSNLEWEQLFPSALWARSAMFPTSPQHRAMGKERMNWKQI